MGNATVGSRYKPEPNLLRIEILHLLGFPDLIS
jgi:hypothetical protein